MKSGPKPKGKILTEWNSKLAYAIGLICADGCLSKDGRHISLTSKDKVQINTFKKCLKLENRVSIKKSGSDKFTFYIQFGDVLFYRFLLNIGITPAKSKTIGRLIIPRRCFFDFLRGYFDGDGTSYSYFDPIYRKSFRFYISFTSASEEFFSWLRVELHKLIGIKGYLSYNRNNAYVQLKFAKRDAILIAKKMYYSKNIPCLYRKRHKIDRSLDVIRKSRSGEIGRRATFRS